MSTTANERKFKLFIVLDFVDIIFSAKINKIFELIIFAA